MSFSPLECLTRLLGRSFFPLIPCLALALPSCDGGEESDNPSEPAPIDPANVLASDIQDPPAPSPTDSLGKSLEEVTGAWSKVAWSQHDNDEKADTYSTGTRHSLWGIDSRDGLGVRPLIEDFSNYSRPLISPDGRMILYTNKEVERKDGVKHYTVTVMATDWQGAEPVVIADGYANDLWRDPDTGEVWVIVARDFKPSRRAAMFARKLVRFRLDDPSIEEVLWDRGEISVDNVQLSRDGQRASGQFPWPEVGFYNFAADDWQRLSHGCWPSQSPDNSYITWVFDGAHRTLTMHQTSTGESWPVAVNRASGIDGAEVYHPRWSNHPRYLAITGPYADGGKGGNPISVGGTHAEVYIGRFSEDLTEVEDWVSLTDNDVGDFYPDLWVHGGHDETLPNFPQGAAGSAATDRSQWPAAGQPLLFGWHHRDHQNEITDVANKTRTCKLEARGLARYGRHHHALLDSGYFVPDGSSSEAIASALEEQAPLSIEGLLTPEPNLSGDEGTVWSLGSLSLVVTEDGLSLRQGDDSTAMVADSAVPMHVIAFLVPGQPIRVTVNGTETATPLLFTPSDPAPLRVGGGQWAGGLQRIAVYRSQLEPATISDLAETASTSIDEREPLPVTRLRGRLVETTPVPTAEEIDPYTSALVEYIYEVEEVLEGDYSKEEALVRHWGLLDRKIVPGFPRDPGTTHDLKLQPWEAHPQLDGERRTDDTGNYTLPVFYDISAPATSAP